MDLESQQPLSKKASWDGFFALSPRVTLKNYIDHKYRDKGLLNYKDPSAVCKVAKERADLEDMLDEFPDAVIQAIHSCKATLTELPPHFSNHGNYNKKH